MAEITLELDIDIYNSFLEEEITLNQFLTEVLKGGTSPSDEFDEGSRREIIAALLSYHSDEGGAPQCDDFLLTDEEYDDESKKGKVNINYDVAYYYSCADMNSESEHYEKVIFEVDTENEVLILHFFKTEQRSTRSEF